ncbi:hypothetical protein [Acaryochloris sp. CCMEE 5410]|uniref:hypothetical protein n=1 Tax=Acaryochloris sp. CCMEE 5410 TaxID=310037 RepID=UPI0011121DEA|nr:hypothetical protein [Acaryochloris sp. CCMEE 5410]KAI9132860.1 hypothetical protein ON05_005560 [Acaryochloris sp. CCMEE 5410]
MADRPVTELTDGEKKELSALLGKFFKDKSISTKALVVDVSTKADPDEKLSRTTKTSLFCRWGCWACQNPPPNPLDPCSPWGLCWDCR